MILKCKIQPPAVKAKVLRLPGSGEEFPKIWCQRNCLLFGALQSNHCSAFFLGDVFLLLPLGLGSTLITVKLGLCPFTPLWFSFPGPPINLSWGALSLHSLPRQSGILSFFKSAEYHFPVNLCTWGTAVTGSRIRTWVSWAGLDSASSTAHRLPTWNRRLAKQLFSGAQPETSGKPFNWWDHQPTCPDVWQPRVQGQETHPHGKGSQGAEVYILCCVHPKQLMGVPSTDWKMATK